MQIFVRNVSGSTLTLDAGSCPSVASLKEALSAKTFIHPQDQRLVYGGKELRDEVNWDAYGLQEESTLDSLLRLPGGAKKKRCEAMLNTTARCDQPSLTMIGECKACTKQFCSTHRLPEDHTCGELASVKEAARQLNSDKLTKDSVAAGANLHNIASY